MRDYAKVSPQFWIGHTGRQIRKLGTETQLVALYLITCPHATMIGVYYMPPLLVAHETGIPFGGALKALQSLCRIGFCSYDPEAEYVWVHEMAIFQIGPQLKPNDNRIRSINEAYQELPNLPFLQAFFAKYRTLFYLEKVRIGTNPSQGALESLPSQEQEQEQDQEQKQEQEIGVEVHDNASSYAPILSTSIISIPLNNHSEHAITQQQIEEWQTLFPAINVLQTLRHIRSWNLANPKKRKTPRGILNHITQWLAKDQNRGGTHSNGSSSHTSSLFDYNQAVCEQWVQENHEKNSNDEVQP